MLGIIQHGGNDRCARKKEEPYAIIAGIVSIGAKVAASTPAAKEWVQMIEMTKC